MASRMAPLFLGLVMVVGVLFALEFVMVGQAVRYTTAGHVVVFLYSAPVFAALGLHLKLPEER
ncbi:MAG TPA: hypothetical protein PLY40_07630, partial [Bacillota bacterium]|nr:hypothetical protein [Bacillota bacterium]